jgi:hypothetical protein
MVTKNCIIKSRRMGWAGHLAQIGKKLITYRLLVGMAEGKRQEDQDVGGWIIF